MELRTVTRFHGASVCSFIIDPIASILRVDVSIASRCTRETTKKKLEKQCLIASINFTKFQGHYVRIATTSENHSGFSAIAKTFDLLQHGHGR